MYTTCEAGNRRSVNHTRALSLASPGRAGPGLAEAVGVGEARRGRPDGRCGARAVRVQVRCGAT